MKKAFTMIELIFVMVILGILTAIAIPRFAGVREDAVISKGKAEVATIRAGIALLKSQRLLEGNTTLPPNLDAATADTPGAPLFNGGTYGNVLSSPLYAKETGKDNGWTKTDDTTYKYYISGTPIPFTYSTTAGTFDCNASAASTGTNCKYLTR
ncbi:type II secretion system protein [Sulfurospirillum diekertiae]|uniref:Type II secretion system protein G n=1 Tax=Sulfurospirillum diekertiae TaxID=1854492 RepID=A0A1Y0HMA0_9BACT|nr:type II secretion system protein [Sulfurospirillum diekertiae]ARU49221.1 hypothetical protein Sdiek1_2062 [Sulfurospirillum diekertiae]ASC94031.1 hypothetical protein Sdiek2_2016 [Sulfurospirillum diekertiae]